MAVVLALTFVPSRPGRAASAVPTRTTWVQGDSVLNGALNQTQSALAGDGWNAHVTAFGGMQLVAAIDLFRQVRPQMGSVAVIELGNNYCCGDPSEFGSEIDQTMSVLSPMHVIFLTTALYESRQADINAQIWSAASRWPNLEVADWSAVVQSEPWVVGPDGLHLTYEGRPVLADFIRQHLDAWYQQFSGPDRPVVSAFGAAPALGPTGQLVTAGNAAGVAPTPSGAGYWVAGGDGGVLTYGDAGYFGSGGGMHLAAPVVGIAPTPSGHGYWLVASDGGVFSFGDATFSGSAGALPLAAPVVGMAPTPSGHGYWLVASDGGVFSFGDAAFYGSAGALHLKAPVQAMASTPDGAGYWLVASDGGVFTYGDAAFSGSAPAAASGAARTAVTHYVGMAARPGGGYWLLGQDAA